MTIRSRIGRLEKAVSPSAPDGPPPEPWTDAERVQALRKIVAQEAGRDDAEPFPHLEGKEYLDAFWPWLLEHGGPWPRWAQEAAVRIGSPESAYAAR